MINENEKLITIATSFVCLLLFVCICIWLVKNVHVNQWEQENWNDRSNSTICWVFSVKKIRRRSNETNQVTGCLSICRIYLDS